MKLFSTANRTVKKIRIASAILLFGVGACSFADDPDFYGYEDNYIIPEPDMIPVMPDDNPGRTVDEMLEIKPAPVKVKKATYQTGGAAKQTYEQTGRFGSKEKISLRKGLNAPDSGIVYGSQKRKGAEEVRPLEVKKQEKDVLQLLSEEEMLSQIIMPKISDVHMIEVVPAHPEIKETVPDRMLPPAKKQEQTDSALSEKPIPSPVQPQAKTALKEEKKADSPVVPETKEPLKEVKAASLPDSSGQTEKEKKIETAPSEASDREKPVSIVPASTANESPSPTERTAIVPLLPAAAKQPESFKRNETISLIPPVTLKELPNKKEERIPFTLKPPAERKTLTLTPPPQEEERIILKQPGQSQDIPSIEIFLDE